MEGFVVRMKTQNKLDDAFVLKAIKGGTRKASAIEKMMPEQQHGHFVKTFRRVDRALQRLRKRGRIKYAPGLGWDLA